MDRSIFYWINGWPDSWNPFFSFFSDATKLTWVRVALGLMLLAMIAVGGRWRKTAILALLAWPLANGITDVFKAVFQMPRPFQELQDVNLRAGWSPSFGTASAHSANMAAVAYVFVRYLKVWGGPWVLIALLTGLSRVYVGVHYPYQVVLGWTVGVFAAFVVTETWEAYVRWNSARRLSGTEPASEAE